MSHTFSACKNCHAVNKIKTDMASKAICGKCKSPMVFHGLVSETTAADFRKIISSSDKPVVVDFWASWCGPCKMYGPEFEKASMKTDAAVFLKINTETEQELSASLGIRGIPCTIVFKNGVEVKRQPGAMSADQVVSFLSSL